MTRARIDSSPAVAGGRVFVGSNDGRLYALDITQRQSRLGIRGRRRAVLVAGHRFGQGRDRIDGRQGGVCGVVRIEGLGIRD